MQNWILNQAAVQGLYDEGFLTILRESAEEVRDISPVMGLITAPQLMTVKVGRQLLDVVRIDVQARTFELRPQGAL